MRKIYTVTVALTLSVWQPGCAPTSGTALTQWGTPCSDYGLTAKQCHARFTDYAQFLAQSNRGAQAANSK